MSGIVRHGVHKPLEDAATEMIRQSLIGVTAMSDKADILTPWKETDRRRREVYVESGVPDPSSRRGLYHRAWNSNQEHLNSRDGVMRGHRTAERRVSSSSLRDFCDGGLTLDESG